MCMTTSEIISSIIALGTLGAAIAAWLAAKTTRDAAQANIIVEVMRYFTSEDMRIAGKTLGEYKRQCDNAGSDFAIAFEKSRNEDVDKARRKAKGYHKTIYSLDRNGKIDDKIVDTLISDDQLDLLLDIIEPLEKIAVVKTFDSGLFEWGNEVRARRNKALK